MTNRITIGLAVGALMLATGCGIPAERGQERDAVSPTVADYCFPSRELAAVKASTTPEYFLGAHPDVHAAVNGVYWGADDREPQGIVYVGDAHLASKKGLISGYLVVKDDGTVQTGEALATRVQDIIDGKEQGTDFVIGTHPLLIVHGAVHEQSVYDRYNVTDAGTPKETMRAALGSVTGTNICFAVSTKPLTMNQWADVLVERGYVSAINLDGGPVAQLAVRNGSDTATYGSGLAETKLIFYRK